MLLKSLFDDFGENLKIVEMFAKAHFSTILSKPPKIVKMFAYAHFLTI